MNLPRELWIIIFEIRFNTRVKELEMKLEFPIVEEYNGYYLATVGELNNYWLHEWTIFPGSRVWHDWYTRCGEIALWRYKI